MKKIYYAGEGDTIAIFMVSFILLNRGMGVGILDINSSSNDYINWCCAVFYSHSESSCFIGQHGSMQSEGTSIPSNPCT